MSKHTLPYASATRLRMRVDGIGVTTLVGAYGCPLDCKMCLNSHMRICPDHCKRITCEELYEIVKVDDLYFLATGGGLTFGGGDSLLHIEFIKEFAEMYPNGWKITVETALNVPWSQIEKGLSAVDYYIIDIKSLNPQIYKAYTGADNIQVIQNLTKLLQTIGNERIHIRVPVIPGYVTKEEQEQEVIQLTEMGFTDMERFTYIDPVAYRNRSKQ